jgi:hypothetical protein
MRIEKTVETSCAPVAKGGRLAREGDTSFFNGLIGGVALHHPS